jgi:hypothetical protein
MRYYATAGRYSNIQNDLDFAFDATSLGRGGQTLHYTYSITAADAAGFTATATRNTTDDAGQSGRTVTVNQAGTVGGTS